MKSKSIFNYFILLPQFIKAQFIRLRKKCVAWYYFRNITIRIHGKIKVLNKDRIQIGNNCALNEGVIIDPGDEIRIGKNVVISPNAMILASDLDVCAPSKHRSGNIVIEDNVWIGAGSIILKDIKIGFGSIIGAGSVVTKDVPRNVVVAGNPAKIIRRIDG